MSNEFLSLREIGRRLSIPPSSVAYYKDRFEAFIPVSGTGKRKKYPAESLSIFKEIRTMFNNNYSAEAVERELSRQYPPRGGNRGQERVESQPGQSSSHVDELAAVLGKMSALLENQARFRSDMDGLRQELAALKTEKAALVLDADGWRAKILSLENEISELRAERAELLALVREHMGRGEAETEHKSGGDERTTRPGELFLAPPLVIRNDQGEYLGVAGKSSPFSLTEFLRLIQRQATGPKKVDTAWSVSGQSATLTICSHGGETDHAHLLELARTRTPNGNDVVELTNLTVDGTPVPRPFLLALFKRIKDGYDI